MVVLGTAGGDHGSLVKLQQMHGACMVDLKDMNSA
jgi:hypothetical protein